MSRIVHFKLTKSWLAAIKLFIFETMQLFDYLSLYSVMQSDGNSFWGNVVLDGFDRASRDEDNILDQIYNSKYIRIFIMMIS